MAFVVEDGTVVAGANSYVSVEYADAYFEVDPNFAPVWGAITSLSTKEAYLRWATRILDQKVLWKGEKTDIDSPLRWPRTGVYDRDGNLIPANDMPEQLLEVTCELMKYVFSSDPTAEPSVDYVKRYKVDVVEIEYQENSSLVSTPPLFNQLLRGLGWYPMPGGHYFGKILKS